MEDQKNYDVRSADDAGVLFGTVPLNPAKALPGSWHWFEIPDQLQVGMSLREWVVKGDDDKLNFSLAFMGDLPIEKLREIPGFVEKLDETNYTVPEETPDVGTGTSN